LFETALSESNSDSSRLFIVRTTLESKKTQPEHLSWSARSSATSWASDLSFTHSKHYFLHLGVSLTTTRSSILRQLIVANSGLRTQWPLDELQKNPLPGRGSGFLMESKKAAKLTSAKCASYGDWTSSAFCACAYSSADGVSF
jgi:hypothetical protein